MSLQPKRQRRRRGAPTDKSSLVVRLETCDDGITVLATVEGRAAHEWARTDQTIAGSRWETPRDMPGVAYAMPANEPGLVDELRREGYRLDVSAYEPPPAAAE